MNDRGVECPSCGWQGHLSETNDMDGPDGEEIPLCPECFLNEELVPVAIPLSETAGAPKE